MDTFYPLETRYPHQNREFFSHLPPYIPKIEFSQLILIYIKYNISALKLYATKWYAPCILIGYILKIQVFLDKPRSVEIDL